jgi:hypothetical protein
VEKKVDLGTILLDDRMMAAAGVFNELMSIS